MPYRLTNIYTRTGDEGYTNLQGNKLPKDDGLIEALGNIDELNSALGLVIALGTQDDSIDACITQIQHDLFNFGAEMHVPERIRITAECVLNLEKQLDSWNHTLPPLTEFLLPRGTPAAAACHLARSICRRTERSLVHLHRQVPLANPQLLCYINRLSDLLFVAARLLSRQHPQAEILWKKD